MPASQRNPPLVAPGRTRESRFNHRALWVSTALVESRVDRIPPVARRKESVEFGSQSLLDLGEFTVPSPVVVFERREADPQLVEDIVHGSHPDGRKIQDQRQTIPMAPQKVLIKSHSESRDL